MPPAAAAARRGRSSTPPIPPTWSATVAEATADDVAAALAAAPAGFADWSARPPAERAAALRRAADLYEANAPELTALATREAGKTLLDAIAELREAVDFLRYYADAAEAATGAPRGTLVCISPWNFPLAIFTGQVAACLGAGNAVIAKPAEQTPLIAARAVELLHEAGVPAAALQLLPGDGPTVGAPLTAAPGIAGVVFTGSTEVAQAINRALAANAAPDAVLIAETGGINAMIVDFDRADRAGGARRARLGLPVRRPALLGAARALRPGGGAAAGAGDARRRDGGADASAIPGTRPPTSAR